MEFREGNKKAFAQWFKDTFSPEELEVLRGKRADVDVTHTAFKNESLDLYGIYDDVRKYPEIQQKVRDRYISHVPASVKIDLEEFKSDKYYRAWFFNRHTFFEAYTEYKDLDFIEYYFWTSIVDNLCPTACKKLHGAIFKKDDLRLPALMEQHWSQVASGCRCHLRGINGRSANNKLTDKDGYLY